MVLEGPLESLVKEKKEVGSEPTQAVHPRYKAQTVKCKVTDA